MIMRAFLKKILLAAGLIAALLFSAVLFLVVGKQPLKYQETELVINNHKFRVELAESLIQQQRGLAGRETLASDRGMLFVFSSPRFQTFWMAGMKLPLDIIWISGNQIIGIEKDLPPAGSGTPIIYTSPFPADKVLEIGAGLSDALGFQVGDTVEMK